MPRSGKTEGLREAGVILRHHLGGVPDVIACRSGKHHDEVTEMTREYKFVRVGQYRGSALFGVQDKARETYQDIVHRHAAEGWRLVQIFAPGIAAFGAAKYYELIFEREKADDVEISGRDGYRVAEAALQS
jgi:Domain of unknown function (DUF4177)